MRDMFKYKFYLTCLILVFIPFLTAAQSDQSFCWGLTGQATNLTYENAHGTNWFNGNFSLLLGFRLNQVTLGLNTDIDYFSYNTSEDAVLALKGGWFDTRSLILAKFQIQPWFDLKMGLGGLLLWSSLNYNELGWISQKQGGISGLFNLGFNFSGFFAGLELQNKFDLLFVDQALNPGTLINTYYLGGLRFDFRPGTDWMTFFTTVNFLVWNSTTEAYAPSIWTTSIDFGIEISSDGTEEKSPPRQNLLIKNDNNQTTGSKNDKTRTKNNKNTNLNKNSTKNTTSTKNTNSNTTKNTNDIQNNSAVAPVKAQKDYESISPSLKMLNEASPGKAVNFPDLLFIEGKAEPSPGTNEILDYIAEILEARDNIIVAIAGYTEIFNEPEKEITVSSSRAQYIKQYLVAKGIDKSRLKINPVTHFALENSKTRIVISVIDLE